MKYGCGSFPKKTPWKSGLRYLKPKSFMTYGINIIFGKVSTAAVTAYGIFYKIQQFIFFAGFGLRDAITPIVSFNYGMGSHKRVKQGIKYGILYISIIMIAGTILLELFAGPLIAVFGLSESTEELCIRAIHVISVGFIFAGGNIAIQGVFQGLGNGISSLVISVLRLFVIVLPLAWLFSTFSNALFWIWFAFPIAEALASDAEIILADEPTGNLDEETQEEILRIFRELANHGKCVIVITHSKRVTDVADEVYTLKALKNKSR